MGAMTMFFAEAFPSFHFKGNYLVAFNLVNDLGLDSSLQILADREFFAGVYQQYFCKFYLIACAASDMRNVQCLVFLDPELLTGYFYDCEHIFNIRAAKVRGFREKKKELAKKTGWKDKKKAISLVLGGSRRKSEGYPFGVLVRKNPGDRKSLLSAVFGPSSIHCLLAILV
jgi:hypothetical protein